MRPNLETLLHAKFPRVYWELGDLDESACLGDDIGDARFPIAFALSEVLDRHLDRVRLPDFRVVWIDEILGGISYDTRGDDGFILGATSAAFEMSRAVSSRSGLPGRVMLDAYNKCVSLAPTESHGHRHPPAGDLDLAQDPIDAGRRGALARLVQRWGSQVSHGIHIPPGWADIIDVLMAHLPKDPSLVHSIDAWHAGRVGQLVVTIDQSLLSPRQAGALAFASTLTHPILFLDIDGVLLSGRAWMLPPNQNLQAKAMGLPRWQAAEIIGREAVFDAAAVALVARICQATRAKIVVCSSWRYSVGLDQTHVKLLEQGLPEDILHADWSCSLFHHGSPDKSVDVSRWLSAHAITHYGTWLVLDDDDVMPGATLRTDALDGVSVRDAAAAVRYFHSTDATLGVGPLPKGDLEQVVRAFQGEWIEACRWLEGADRGGPRRRRPSALITRGEREEARRRLEAAVSRTIDRWW